MAQDCCTTTTFTGEHEPVDVSYTEPSGWSSKPQHCANRTEAERVRDEINLLAPAAAQRRTWTIAPCTCGGAR